MNPEIGETTNDLTSTNTERQSALDAIPTSSTDANTTFVKSEIRETGKIETHNFRVETTHAMCILVNAMQIFLKIHYVNVKKD